MKAPIPQGLTGSPNYFGLLNNLMTLIICESLREIGEMACVTSAWSSRGQTLKLRLEDSESRCSHLESKVRMQRSLESVKWEEFEKLATTMREFSRSMSPSKSGSLADY